MEEVLSDNKKFNDNIIYKNSLEYVKELDKIIDRLNYECFKISDIKIYDKVVVESKEIEGMFKDYFKSMPLFRRSKKIKRIIYSKIKDERDNLVREIKKEYEDTIKKLSETELKVQQNHLEFVRRNKIRETILEVIRVKRELDVD